MGKKKYSIKMRVFYCSLFCILICIAGNLFTLKSENVFIAGIWGIVTLAGIAVTGKAADDFQKSAFFNKELYNEEKEVS